MFRTGSRWFFPCVEGNSGLEDAREDELVLTEILHERIKRRYVSELLELSRDSTNEPELSNISVRYLDMCVSQKQPNQN